MWPNPQETVDLVTFILNKSLLENFNFMNQKLILHISKAKIYVAIALQWIKRIIERAFNFLSSSEHKSLTTTAVIYDIDDLIS